MSNYLQLIRINRVEDCLEVLMTELSLSQVSLYVSTLFLKDKIDIFAEHFLSSS